MYDPCAPPTLEGFQAFITGVMGIPAYALPSASPVIPMALKIACRTVNRALAATGIYALAVYNLGGSFVINFAPDQAGKNYFQELRKSYGITAFVAGVISGSADQGTSQTIAVPDSLKNLTLSDLQQLKDPYGRQYLAFAQDYGPAVWGIS